MIIELGNKADIDELEKLYDDLNDYLSKGINYPGWVKGVYPTRQDAAKGINNNNLYVARKDGKIIGSIILSHKPENAYYKAKWSFDSDYTDVFVVYTFAVHPDFLKQGIGKELLNFSFEHCRKNGAKSIRLDVYEKTCQQ